MFKVNADISVNLERTTFTPGEVVTGSIDFETASSIDISTIQVALEGRIVLKASKKRNRRRETKITHVSRRKGERKQAKSDNSLDYDPHSDDSDSGEDTASEHATILNKSVTVFPPDHMSDHKALTISGGTYHYNFQIRIPDSCEGTDSLLWNSIELPPSLTLPSKRGYIEYRVCAVVHRPGVFSRSTKANTIFRLVDFSKNIQSSEIATTDGRVDMDIFTEKQPTNKFFFKMKKNLGVNDKVHTHPINAVVQVPAQGIPVGGSLPNHQGGTKLRDFVKIYLHSPNSVFKFYLVSFKVILEGTYVIRAKKVAETYNIAYHIVEDKEKHLLDFSNRSIDISELLGDAAIPGTIVPSLFLPQLHVAYQLKVKLSFAMTDPNAAFRNKTKLAAHVTLLKPRDIVDAPRRSSEAPRRSSDGPLLSPPSSQPAGTTSRDSPRSSGSFHSAPRSPWVPQTTNSPTIQHHAPASQPQHAHAAHAPRAMNPAAQAAQAAQAHAPSPQEHAVSPQVSRAPSSARRGQLSRGPSVRTHRSSQTHSPRVSSPPAQSTHAAPHGSHQPEHAPVEELPSYENSEQLDPASQFPEKAFANFAGFHGSNV